MQRTIWFICVLGISFNLVAQSKADIQKVHGAKETSTLVVGSERDMKISLSPEKAHALLQPLASSTFRYSSAEIIESENTTYQIAHYLDADQRRESIGNTLIKENGSLVISRMAEVTECSKKSSKCDCYPPCFDCPHEVEGFFNDCGFLNKKPKKSARLQNTLVTLTTTK